VTQLLATSNTATSDGELLGRIRAGDAVALGDLYDRHAGHALRVALRVLGSREEAEDVVQETFWRLWSSRALYDPMRGRFRSWLSALARNRAIDVVRGSSQRSSIRSENPGSLAVDEDSPEENVDAALQRRRAAIDALCDAVVAIVQDLHLEGFARDFEER